MLLGPVGVVVVIFVVGTSCKPPKIVKSTVFANPQKASNRRCFRDFSHLGTNRHRKYRCFWLRANAKPRYLRGFEPLLAKIKVFTVFCGPGLAKHWYLRSFLHVVRSFFWMPKAQKHCKLHDFYAWTVPKNYEKLTKKRPKNAQQGLPKRIFKFYHLFSHPENPSRLKDFREGSAAAARPRVAKA